MRYSSFEAVAKETRDVQVRLLHSADATERVWSVWSLGLQQGREAIPFLDPLKQLNPGVRRHLALVLSSLHHREPVRVLAESDPDAHVRATACDYLVRTSSEEEKPDTLKFLNQRLLKESDSVPVRTVLETLPLNWPPLDLQVLERGLRSAQRGVREAFVQYLVARYDQVKELRDLLRARLTTESDPMLLEQLVDATLTLPSSFSSLLSQMIADTSAQIDRLKDESPAYLADEGLDINEEVNLLEKRLLQFQDALKRVEPAI